MIHSCDNCIDLLFQLGVALRERDTCAKRGKFYVKALAILEGNVCQIRVGHASGLCLCQTGDDRIQFTGAYTYEQLRHFAKTGLLLYIRDLFYKRNPDRYCLGSNLCTCKVLNRSCICIFAVFADNHYTAVIPVVIREIYRLQSLFGNTQCGDAAVKLTGYNAGNQAIPVCFDDLQVPSVGIADLACNLYVVSANILVGAIDGPCAVGIIILGPAKRSCATVHTYTKGISFRIFLLSVCCLSVSGLFAVCCFLCLLCCISRSAVVALASASSQTHGHCSYKYSCQNFLFHTFFHLFIFLLAP